EEVQELADGSWRVSVRFDIDDLEDLTGIAIDDEDVDTVGGLLAKHLGKVPIPGSTVEVEGLELIAEAPSGRRNRVGLVHIMRVGQVDDNDTLGASVASGHGSVDA